MESQLKNAEKYTPFFTPNQPSRIQGASRVALSEGNPITAH
jgi:hypothetical protein